MGLIKKGHSFLRQCISDPNYLDKYLFCHLFDYSFSEYERYHFFDKNVNRLSFISFKESNKIIQKYNKVQTNKKENYERFHEYFGRDCCLLNLSKEENRKKLYSFIQKHKRFVVKKYDGSSGVGIKIIETEESQEWINDFLDEYQDGCLLEEIIKQSKDIANIYPLSVNTLRITTVNYGNCIEAIYPVMRFGMGNQFTDNKSKFCLFCAINEETKEIINVVDWQGEIF